MCGNGAKITGLTIWTYYQRMVQLSLDPLIFYTPFGAVPRTMVLVAVPFLIAPSAGVST